MVFYGKKNRAVRKRGYKRRRGASSTKARKVSTAVRSYVRRAIHSNLENKCWISYAANQTVMSAGTSLPIYSINLLPNSLSQGVGKAGRIGNEINLRSGTIYGRVNLLPYNVTTNPTPSPVLVRFFLLSCKQTNQPTMTSSVQFGTFFEIGNTASLPQGNSLDMVLPVNNDFWTLYASKVVELGCTATGSGFATGAIYDNSKFSYGFKFSFGKYVKRIKYDDATTPQINRNLFLCIQPVYADGSNTSGYIPLEVHYCVKDTFEDA